jgi:membrane-associated protease RseP (regulator of RpoE activity)
VGPHENKDNQVTPPSAVTPPAEPAPEEPEAAPEEPPMTPMRWMIQNGPFLAILGLAVILVYRNYGFEAVWKGAIVLFGLGFLIFVHELGHFLAAKWCDVYVQTFSIGFGPAIPGCSFRKGETTYKLAVFPLGGYVSMLGEGPEADEDENNPRSFKNKSVGARMLIISAGVIMNVVVGGLLFILVYMADGEHYQPATVGTVEPSSPMWKEGVRTGNAITKISSTRSPTFFDLKLAVALSAADEVIPFTFEDPATHAARTVDLKPRKEPSDPNPVIGVMMPGRLKLPSDPGRPDVPMLAVVQGSAAAAARELRLLPGEVVIATTDPEHEDQVLRLAHDLAKKTFDYKELARRVRKLAGKKLVLKVVAAGGGQASDRDIPLPGFAYSDTIVGMTRRQNNGPGYDPFQVDTLPEDPRSPGSGQADPFELDRRMQQFIGQPVIVRVQREGSPSSQTVDLYVPPAYHLTFGTWMRPGEVAATRKGSSAEAAGVLPGDRLVKVEMRSPELQVGGLLMQNTPWGAVAASLARGDVLQTWDDIDPERLPYQLSLAAHRRPGKKQVVLKVERSGKTIEHVTLPPADWDESWDFDQERPSSTSGPVAIPQLGLAYWIESQIVDVRPGSPAAAAGLHKGDTLVKAWVKAWGHNFRGDDWTDPLILESERNGKPVWESWAQVSSWMWQHDFREWRFSVKGGSDLITMTAVEDPDWPITERGLQFIVDQRTRKAQSVGEALLMGFRRTVNSIKDLYLQLRSLITGRVSTKNLGGPLQMAAITYTAIGGGVWSTLTLLALISINLAVVNFLPIPILDGGHMVFLIYEKLRGRPASETVRAIGTYIGLAAILLLMGFVFYQDICKLFRL